MKSLSANKSQKNHLRLFEIKCCNFCQKGQNFERVGHCTVELMQKKLWKFHVPILNIISDIAATRFEISWNTQNKKIAKEVEQYYFRTSSVSKTHSEGTSFILLSLSGLQGVNIPLFQVLQLLSPTFGPFGAFATRMAQSVMVQFLTCHNTMLSWINSKLL